MKKVFEQPIVALEILQVEEDLMAPSLVTTWNWAENDEE